jgi:hypothetical protein
VFISTFYPKITEYTNKKSSLLIQQAALFLFSHLNTYGKSPQTRWILLRRPPPTGIFTVNLPHNLDIKPNLLPFVNPQSKNNFFAFSTNPNHNNC